MRTIPAVVLFAVLVFPSLVGAVDAPTGLVGTQVAERGVSWSWAPVDDAVSYEVTVDGIAQGLVDSPAFSSGDLFAGTHSLHLRAIDEGGDFSEQSRTLKIQVRRDFDPVPTAVDAPSDDDPDAGASRRDDTDALDAGLVDIASRNYPGALERDGLELVFSDEFDGDELNPVRWNTQLRWDGDWNGERFEYRVVNEESQFYVNVLSDDPEHLETVVPVYDPFQFSDGRLAIRATRNPLKRRDGDTRHGPLDSLVSQQEFLSGVISTYDKFSRRYGYFEARIRIPDADGTFPAFWLYHQTRRSVGHTQRTEIDIMENLGHAPHYIYNSFHYFKNASVDHGGDAHFVKPSPSGQIHTGTDYSEAFHIYAVRWEPGRITWFIDDEQVSEVRNDEADFEDLYLQINLAIGGKWVNYPRNAGGLGRRQAARFPNEEDLANFDDPALEIDYVRVYAPR